MIKTFIKGHDLAAPSEPEAEAKAAAAAEEMPTRNEFYVHPRVNFRHLAE
jgi:hypothetical protein